MFELILLFVLLFLLSMIVYKSIKIGISPTPSSLNAAKTICEITKKSDNLTIIDLGSGFGFLALYLGYHNKSKKVIAYEISYIPYLISLLLQKILQVKNVSFKNENFLHLPLVENITYVCYLFPEAMKDLDVKILDENINISLLVSSTFALNGLKAKNVYYLNDLYKTPIYTY